MLKIGERAPEFILRTDRGDSLALTGLRGRKVLLWFFLEADTPG